MYWYQNGTFLKLLRNSKNYRQNYLFTKLSTNNIDIRKSDLSPTITYINSIVVDIDIVVDQNFKFYNLLGAVPCSGWQWSPKRRAPSISPYLSRYFLCIFPYLSRYFLSISSVFVKVFPQYFLSICKGISPQCLCFCHCDILRLTFYSLSLTN